MLVVIYLAIIVLSLTTLTASAYGIGKNEDRDDLAYKVSIAFFIMSLIASVGIFTFIHQGNYISNECKIALFTKSPEGKKAALPVAEPVKAVSEVAEAVKAVSEVIEQ